MIISPQKDIVGLPLIFVFRDPSKPKGSDGKYPAIDISAATVKQIIFQKPTHVITTKTASFVTDGTDGKIRYLTQANDIDEAGLWAIQGYIVMGLLTAKTSIANMYIEKNLGE